MSVIEEIKKDIKELFQVQNKKIFLKKNIPYLAFFYLGDIFSQEEKSKGNTILFSSHILSEVQRVCDRVAIIKNGNILKVENVETLRNNNFKKVQVKYNGELPNLIIEGISDYKKQNSKIEFLYKGNINNLLTALASHKVENASITEPPLEDIFLHYYESEE